MLAHFVRDCCKEQVLCRRSVPTGRFVTGEKNLTDSSVTNPGRIDLRKSRVSFRSFSYEELTNFFLT